MGALAKGYAAEKVGELVREQGFTSGLISVGGNIKILGKSMEGSGGWRIAIQDPENAQGTVQQNTDTILIQEGSLVTSGNYQRYYTVAGERYHHIIDPQTLMPSRYFTGVTVICEDSALADALSTFFFLTDEETAREFCKMHEEIEVYWIGMDGEISMTDEMKKLLK